MSKALRARVRLHSQQVACIEQLSRQLGVSCDDALAYAIALGTHQSVPDDVALRIDQARHEAARRDAARRRTPMQDRLPLEPASGICR